MAAPLTGAAIFSSGFRGSAPGAVDERPARQLLVEAVDGIVVRAAGTRVGIASRRRGGRDAERRHGQGRDDEQPKTLQVCPPVDGSKLS